MNCRKRPNTQMEILRFFESKDYTLLHQNIAGILSKVDDLELALEDLVSNKYVNSVDIICLTETFIKRGSETNLKLNNYTVASQFTRTRQRRGGTCILIKKHLDFIPLCELYKIVEPVENHFEYCGIKINSLNVTVIVIYRTPSSDIELFFGKLESLLYKLNPNQKKKTNNHMWTLEHKYFN